MRHELVKATSRVKSRRSLSVIFCTSVLLALTWSLATPARASVEGLMVSVDGVNFEAGRSLPLFDEFERVIPGDRYRDSVWVRNDAAFATRLRVDVLKPATDSPELAQGLTIAVSEHDSGSGKSLTLNDTITNGSCTVLDTGISLHSGEVKRLDFDFAISPALDRRDGAGAKTHFAVRGVLEEASVPDLSKPGGKCIQPGGNEETPITRPPGALSYTGADSLAILALVAVLAVGGGVVAGTFAWRRRDDNTDKPHPKPSPAHEEDLS